MKKIHKKLILDVLSIAALIITIALNRDKDVFIGYYSLAFLIFCLLKHLKELKDITI